MAVSSGTSLVLSSILSVLLFSGMQMYRQWLASTQFHTILGGYLASVLFILMLTAIGNLETTVFGKTFQTKLFPEVIFCLIVSVTAAGMIHRVCTTTCQHLACIFIFHQVSLLEETLDICFCLVLSLIALYYVDRISQKTHAQSVPPALANKLKNIKKNK